jgi:hypothetical protein
VQGSDAEELELVPGNLTLHEVPVNNVYGNVNRFGNKTESLVDIEQPVNKYLPHVRVYLDLRLNVQNVY